MPTYRNRVYGVGTLAYADTLYSGLVPCKVVAIGGWDRTQQRRMIEVKLTASRGAYRRGEVLDLPDGSVIPRDKVRTRDHKIRIITSYGWDGNVPAGGHDHFMGPCAEGIGTGDAIYVNGRASIVERVTILPRGHGQAPIRDDYLCIKVETADGNRYFGATDASIGPDLRVHFKIESLETYDPTDERFTPQG